MALTGQRVDDKAINTQGTFQVQWILEPPLPLELEVSENRTCRSNYLKTPAFKPGAFSLWEPQSLLTFI